eukprot:scaffold12210_cov124-Isochrysis_galbana.AAC.1
MVHTAFTAPLYATQMIPQPAPHTHGLDALFAQGTLIFVDSVDPARACAAAAARTHSHARQSLASDDRCILPRQAVHA